MTNEEKILELLSMMQKDISGLKGDVSGLKEGQARLESRLGNVENNLSNVDNRLGNVENNLSNVDNRLGNVENNLSNVDNRLGNVETQLGENTQMVKAIRHNQEFTNAKLEAVETTTAKAAALTKLDSKFEVLNRRLFDQEAEIQTLKLAK